MAWDAATNEDYEERAAIMQYCGKLPKVMAERRARDLIENRLKQSVPKQMQLVESEGERFFREMGERHSK